jgi:hypothetical protein
MISVKAFFYPLLQTHPNPSLFRQKQRNKEGLLFPFLFSMIFGKREGARGWVRKKLTE